jgi:hypothetical protein
MLLVLLVCAGSTGLLVVPQCPRVVVVVLIGETEDEVQSSHGLLVPLDEVVTGPTTLEVVLLEVHSPSPWV